jgi:phosphate uptake regulator
MEVRKLQLIGGSSYMISLPKKWIRANKLDRGDELVLFSDENHIQIYPKKHDKNRITRALVKKIPRYDENFLSRFIHALYIQGLDEVVIEDRTLSPPIITKLSEIIRTLIGMEMIDATDNHVILRCFTTDFDTVEILRRITQIIAEMMGRIEDGIRLRDREELKEVFQLKKDSDRLYLLALRQENRVVREIATKWDESTVIERRTMIKLLEEITNSLQNFSMHMLKVLDEVHVQNLLIPIGNMNEVFQKVFQAYRKNDVGLAEDAIEMAESIQNDIAKSIPIPALEALLSVCKYIKLIGEITFNKAVRESLSYSNGLKRE